jgi:hypothetical protein
MFKFLAKLFRKPAIQSAAIMPRSRKHIRVTYWTFDVRIAYYDHAGRKVTYRRYPTARASAMIKSARAKGYKVIGA